LRDGTTRRAFILSGIAAGAVASTLDLEGLLADDACDRLPYDIPYSDSRLPFHHVILEQLTPSWRDAATGIESHGLIDLRFPLGDELRDANADAVNSCSQMFGNPGLVLKKNGALLIIGYGYSTKPKINENTGERDWRQGDSVVIIRRNADGSYQRLQESALAFPPASTGQLWNTVGGFGTGMSVIQLQRPLRSSGFQFLGLVNHINLRDHREMWTLAGSPDGVDWYFEGAGGVPTKDAFSARPFMASYDFAPLRNMHGVLIQDAAHDRVYALLGHAASYSLCTYLARFNLDTDKPFGHGDGAFIDVWQNKIAYDDPVRAPLGNASTIGELKNSYAHRLHAPRPYLTEGFWRPSTGIWTKEQTENVGAHAYLSDLVDPMAATPLDDERFVLTHESLQKFASPSCEFRIGVITGDDSPPFLWGPRGGVDLGKLWSNGYLACTAGGVAGALLPRADGKIEVFVTTARQSCWTGHEDEIGYPGCTYQPGGLKHGIARAFKY
jgi:hypothetical protein